MGAAVSASVEIVDAVAGSTKVTPALVAAAIRDRSWISMPASRPSLIAAWTLSRVSLSPGGATTTVGPGPVSVAS